MADSPYIPHSNSPPLGPDGRWTGEWWRFLRDLAATPGLSSDQSAAISELAERVAALEAGGATAEIQGLLSVLVGGQLSEGIVQLQLKGDSANPGNTYYYGTNASGEKGFYPVPQPVIDHNRITADGNFRATADGALRITR